MSMSTTTRTEHAGAKNGGGYWGRRAEAKAVCDKLRRANDRHAIRDALAYLDANREAVIERESRK